MYMAVTHVGPCRSRALARMLAQMCQLLTMLRMLPRVLATRSKTPPPDLSENILEKLAGKLDSNTPDLGDAKSVAGDAADKVRKSIH